MRTHVFVAGVCRYTINGQIVKLASPRRDYVFQGHRHLFEVGEDGGPTLFAERFDGGILGRSPSRHDFLDLSSAFCCNRQFHASTASAAIRRNQTIALQWPEIPNECRALDA